MAPVVPGSGGAAAPRHGPGTPSGRGLHRAARVPLLTWRRETGAAECHSQNGESGNNHVTEHHTWPVGVEPHSKWRDRDRGVPFAACCRSRGFLQPPAPLTPLPVSSHRETPRQIALKALGRRRSSGGGRGGGISGSRKDRRLREEWGSLSCTTPKMAAQLEMASASTQDSGKGQQSCDATPKMAVRHAT